MSSRFVYLTCTVAMDSIARMTIRTNLMGYITVIARFAKDLWRRKQTLSSGFTFGLGSFTTINPWPRAITITYCPSM